jgi:hypothetical protein
VPFVSLEVTHSKERVSAVRRERRGMMNRRRHLNEDIKSSICVSEKARRRVALYYRESRDSFMPRVCVCSAEKNRRESRFTYGGIL